MEQLVSARMSRLPFSRQQDTSTTAQSIAIIFYVPSDSHDKVRRTL